MTKTMTYPRIAAVATGPQRTVTVTWKDGIVHTIDLTEWLTEFPVFQSLLADDTRFAAVQTGEWGEALNWSDDQAIPDDVLWSLGLAQDADSFRKWRKARGLTQEQAAAELGISSRMITYYEAGTHPIPKTITLARIGSDAVRDRAVA